MKTCLVKVSDGYFSLQECTIKELKPGSFFTRKPLPYPNENQVWIKCPGGYDTSTKKYTVCKWFDINHESYLKGDTTVYTDFIF